jgi:glyoxylase-like metal-dependent hydrolase (beta-lactamase superfamily II)
MERPEIGTAVELEPGVRLILAPNPSPMTHWGTNTYLVGNADLIVIDPGPDDPAHLAAILAASQGARVAAVLVTHPHGDHSPLAARLARRTGAPVMGFGPPDAGRSAVMAALAAEGEIGGGEGVDVAFQPDTVIGESAVVAAGDARIEVIHTPGHFSGHLSFVLGDAVFTGDHVMGWASTLVSPPDGDVASFMATTSRLRERCDRVFYPGHGAPVEDPGARLDWLLGHRKAREAAILDALRSDFRSVADITALAYPDVDPALHPAAERNVLAHLIDLSGKQLVVAEPRLSADARFRRS